jgi:hypothetical protein
MIPPVILGLTESLTSVSPGEKRTILIADDKDGLATFRIHPSSEIKFAELMTLDAVRAMSYDRIGEVLKA